MSLRHLLRGVIGLLSVVQRRRFALLGLFSATNALLEAAAALFVLALVGAVTAMSRGAPPTTGGSDPIGSITRSILGDGATARGVTVVLAVATLAFYVIKNASAYLEHYFQQRLVHQAAADASATIVGAYLRVPLDYHYRQRSGDVLRSSWDATELLYRRSLLGVVYLAAEGLAATALLVVLIVLAPLVTLVVVLTLSATLLGLYRVLRPRMTAWGIEEQALSAQSLHAIQEAFGAVRDARIAGREPFLVERYRRHRWRLARTLWRSGTATAVPRFAVETAFIVTMVVTVALLAAQGRTGSETVALLGLYGYAGLRLMPSANRVLLALGNLRLGEGALDVVRDALAVPQELSSRSGATCPRFTECLAVEDVTYQFPGTDVPALVGVSLTVDHGESVGIIGPSGGGKSTLVDVLVGLLAPAAGRVTVDGHDIADDLAGWRRQIGYVSQTVFLLDDAMRANVAFGVAAADIDDEQVWDALEQAQLAAFVQGLPQGLDTPLGELGVRLSGGQRQRVAIARALYHRPELLVFDEATAALDTSTEDELTAAIETLARTRTVITVAHRLSTIRTCDRLVLMEAGRVSDVGTFDELDGRNGAFRDLVAAGRF